MSNELRASFPNLLAWFKGKPQQNAAAALERLAVAAERGFWLPEDKSRSIRAALNKSNLAYGTARYYGVQLRGAPYGSAMHEIGHCMEFGLFERAQKVNQEALRTVATGVAFSPTSTVPANAAAAGLLYATSFALVVQALQRLDATRPQPVFTEIGASPTVTATLKGLGLDVLPKARVCPVKYERVEFEHKGKPMIGWTVEFLWPEGTVHGASRYSHRDSQCEACGHGIKRDNWVPLLLDNAAGVPHSLWTGRDCCRTIFGIKVTGDIKLKETE